MINFFNYHTDELNRDELREDIEQLSTRGVVEGYNYSNVMTIIAKNSSFAYAYTLYITRGRNKQLEPIILTDMCDAFYYAKDVIKGRWLELEPKLIQSPGYAWNYAKFIMMERWPESEPHIKKSNYWWDRYNELFGVE